MQVRLEEVDFLSRNDMLDVNIVDRSGWTVLQRLAAHGNAADVRKVIHLGADIHHRHVPLGWCAIFHATYFGNPEAFLELLGQYPEEVIGAEDERGWTLLHVAASAGMDDIARSLMKLGANPGAVSKPFYSHMPESIRGLCCTPREVAAAHDAETARKFEDILLEFGIGDETDEGSGDECEFVDALEKIPLP